MCILLDLAVTLTRGLQYLEPAVFELRVLIGQRAGSIFHSIPRELIVSRASVSRGNNSNCFHGKQFWPSLAYISLADSKSVRRVARVFHSIPRELIVSRASVSRGNNSNCFHGKQFWPSLAYIPLADSKSVRRVARVTTRFREPRGALVAPSLRSGRYSPGPLGSLKRVVTRSPRLTYIHARSELVELHSLFSTGEHGLL